MTTNTSRTEFPQFPPTAPISDTDTSTSSGSNARPMRRNPNHRLSRVHPYQRPQTRPQPRPSWLERVCNEEVWG